MSVQNVCSSKGQIHEPVSLFDAVDGGPEMEKKKKRCLNLKAVGKENKVRSGGHVEVTQIRKKNDGSSKSKGEKVGSCDHFRYCLLRSRRMI